MNQPGKIVIKDNKVYFEYYTLPPPIVKDFKKIKFDVLVEYEASKQLVEVENVSFIKSKGSGIYDFPLNEIVKNNQPCEAEVTDKAIITKIY